MTNWYSVFYWMTVADNVKQFFDSSSTVFTWMAGLSLVCVIASIFGRAIMVSSNRLETKESDLKDPDVRAWEAFRKYSIRIFYPAMILSLITWTGFVAIPSKKDCLLIVAGGAVGNFITRDSSAKALPSDITSFLHLSLKNEISKLNEDDQKAIGVETPKDKLISKVKTSKISDAIKNELIDYIQSDSTK